MYRASRLVVLMYIRNILQHGTGAQAREKAGPLLGGGVSEGVRLNDNQIVVSRGAQRIPQMGYL
jgi:hypothetical protein